MSIPKSAKLGIACLFAISIFTAFLLLTARADKPAVKTADPNAVEIVEKVKSLYANLDSYSSRGEVSSYINGLPEVRDEDLEIMGASRKEFDESIKRSNFNGTFNMKLARPDYYIEWERPWGDELNLAGALWLEGEQHFVFVGEQKFLSVNWYYTLSSVMAPASGALNTAPSLFVPMEKLNILDLSKGVNREDDEIIDGEDYYVISNSDMKYWISKKTFLIRKRQQVLKFKQFQIELSQDGIVCNLDHRGRPVTNETIRQFEKVYKAIYETFSAMENVITEIHRDIVVNQPIDFKPYISKYADMEITEPVKEKRDQQTVSNIEKARAKGVDLEELAAQVALEWLKLIDDEDYDKSWEKAAEYLKNVVGKEQFQKSVESVRRPLGKVISRKVKSKNYTRQLPGAPDGEYVVLEFDTSFENKSAAIETVTPMLDKDGIWRVSGYYIK